jgi:pyruvate dehydrogenase E2 component (dihydrolipoamide acetyltransferase)
MSGIVSQFAKLRSEVEQNQGVKLTYTDILIKAAARAIADHPLANAALIGEEIRAYKEVNVGVAVAAPGGLIVPVVRNADDKSLVEVSAELKSLIERCRAGKLTGEDLSGGTFTLTNLGAYGIDTFDPIIVSPQSCILGVGRIAEKPVAAAGAVVVRSMMNLCLSFDHRVMDGAPAAEFLRRVKELLESPLLVFI